MLVEHYRKSLESRLEGYEALLSKQKYMAGDVSLPLPLIRRISRLISCISRTLIGIFACRYLSPLVRFLVEGHGLRLPRVGDVSQYCSVGYSSRHIEWYDQTG